MARRFFSEVLLNKLQLSLDSFVETRNSYGYLCHLCDSQAAKYFKHQDKLRKIEEDVVEKAHHLTRVADLNEAVQSTRRPLTNTSTTRKRARTTSGQMEEHHIEDNEVESMPMSSSSSSSSNSVSSKQNADSPNVTVSCILFNCNYLHERSI